MADPIDEDQLDACCSVCGSKWHATENHEQVQEKAVASLVGVPGEPEDEFPPGYDPFHADRLIGRDPSGAQ